MSNSVSDGHWDLDPTAVLLVSTPVFLHFSDNRRVQEWVRAGVILVQHDPSQIASSVNVMPCETLANSFLPDFKGPLTVLAGSPFDDVRGPPTTSQSIKHVMGDWIKPGTRMLREFPEAIIDLVGLGRPLGVVLMTDESVFAYCDMDYAASAIAQDTIVVGRPRFAIDMRHMTAAHRF